MITVILGVFALAYGLFTLYLRIFKHLTSSSSKIMITEEDTITASSPVFYKSDLTLPAATCSGQVILWFRPS